MSIRIVLAEDETDIGRLTFFTLRRDGYEVYWEKDGQSALHAVLLKKPDLVVLDINMPIMDGYEVFEKLKENEHTKDIPVIFLTAKSHYDDVVKGIRLGIDDYIVKPFEPYYMSSRVRKVLGLKDREVEQAEQEEQDQLKDIDEHQKDNSKKTK